MNQLQIARFWSKVDRTSSECWPWTGLRSRTGYGRLRLRKRDLNAHRVSWELAHGPIPFGLFVCHHCDNPICVNPLHLFLGTSQDNTNDKVAKQRQAKGEALRVAQSFTKARGDRNGTRTHPEARTRGDAHWTRRLPEKAKANGRRGEQHHGAKLTAAQVLEIRRLRAEDGLTLTAIAARFGVVFQRVSAIVNRKSWQSI